jgi:hypothetical protein
MGGRGGGGHGTGGGMESALLRHDRFSYYAQAAMVADKAALPAMHYCMLATAPKTNCSVQNELYRSAAGCSRQACSCRHTGESHTVRPNATCCILTSRHHPCSPRCRCCLSRQWPSPPQQASHQWGSQTPGHQHKAANTTGPGHQRNAAVNSTSQACPQRQQGQSPVQSTPPVH